MLPAVLWTGSCARNNGLPVVGSDQYRNLCSAFYLGLTALQSGEDINARKGLVEATQIAPNEPAGWLNLGLLQFRQQDFEGAYQSVARALTMAADSSRVEALLGVVESRRGKPGEAIAHLSKAVALDGRNLKATFALAQETERQNSAVSDQAAQGFLEKILAVQPNNVAVLLEDVRLAAKRGDGVRVKAAVASLTATSNAWPEPARAQLTSLQEAINGNVHQAAIQAQFLKNVLVRAPAYRQSLDEVRTPATSAGEPFLKFFKLPSPRSEPDEPDAQLRFERTGWKSNGDAVKWLHAVTLDNKSEAVAAWIDGAGTHVGGGPAIAFPPANAAVNNHSVAAADLNYDFRTDLAIACSEGLRLYQGEEGGAFRNVTAATKLPAAVLRGPYTGVWAFDYDLDGDLDLVLGAKSGAPLVLRNNGDGSFAVAHPFSGADGLLDFASADVDGDGDPDVALLDGSGALIVFANERLGDYRRRTTPAELRSPAAAITSADVNGDGLADFVVLQNDRQVMRLSDQNAGKSWTSAVLARLNGPADSVMLADVDNNGALDLLAGDEVFLSDGKTFTPLKAGFGAIADAADLDGDGQLDVLGSVGGVAATWRSHGAKDYHWQTVRPLAARTGGDQRMNSFGVGGEIELRADLLTQKQIIHGPNMHFGMGKHNGGVQFARIGWPNGLIQTEFNLKANQTLLAEQRLKGSCPLLYAWDGKEMRFLKDVAPMSGALGAHDGDGSFTPVRQTREWFRITGEELKPKDGVLRLSVTDEYWESYFIDQYELLAVDHPRGSQVFVDERVAVPPVAPKIYVTGPLHEFAAVHDEPFTRDTYVGIGRDHATELTLPADAPRDKNLYLIAQGSLRPWDDTTLVALNQSSHTKPKGLAFEALDASGCWRMVSADLGVPAGRFKTVVLSLQGVFAPTGPHRVRLRTNLAIYWDRLSWAEALPDGITTVSPLPLSEATLRHRGFSAVAQDAATGIERADYRNVVESGDRWPSLEGYYTRYGDVRSLLDHADSRYVIATSGDELQLSFREAKVPANSVRDYVFVGDGWIKEGDYSFSGSQRLLPLPYQGLRSYAANSKGLEEERAFQLHRDDWQIFHTRYLSGETLRSALWR